MTHRVTNYEEAVELLYRIPRFNPNHSLAQIKLFLTRMGQPDRQMKFVHIAGTNGKGSTSAYLAGLLERCGLKVGLFTSPHLVEVRERFRINGQMISEALFTEAVQFIQQLLIQDGKAAQTSAEKDLKKMSCEAEHTLQDNRIANGLQKNENSGYTPCFFDVMFYIAMYAFQKEQVDMVVLETGLGGRLDATNAVSEKCLTLITHIGLDHTEYLGNTLEEIALEKAGIMKAGVPCVVGAHNESCRDVFTKKATELGTTCRILDSCDYSCHGVYEKAVAFSYFSGYYGSINITLNTTAIYQVDNAALALAGLEALIASDTVGLQSISPKVICDSLWQTAWAGRMEEVTEGVYLDGAHNPDGIDAFLSSVKLDGCKGRRFLIFSAVADKNLQQMSKTIVRANIFDCIILTELTEARRANLQSLADCFKQSLMEYVVERRNYTFTSEMQGIRISQERIYTEPDISQVLRLVEQEKDTSDHIYITGSLYLVGMVKNKLGERKLWNEQTG